MADRDPFALEQLYDAVRARFAEDGLQADQPFGRRAHTKQMGDRDRITWAYGDANGNLGKIGAARRPGGEPARPLAMLPELFCCRLTGVARGFAQDDPHHERAQYVATRKLFDAWYRAVYLHAYGQFEIVSARWIWQKNEGQADAALEVVGAIQAAIPDAIVPETTEPVHAEIDVTLADVTEVETAPET